MQFSLTELQNEIKENAQKLLSEKVDLLELIKKVDEKWIHPYSLKCLGITCR